MALKGGYNKGKKKEKDYSKICSNCGKLKHKDEFAINQLQAGDRIVRRAECKECRKWKKPIPAKVKAEYIKRHPKPEIGSTFFCPVCGRNKPVITNMSVALDHDHYTGKIRGYICLACNTGMGQLKDNAKILERSIEWIKGTLKN